MPLDDEFNKLLSEVHSQNITGYLYRAYTVLGGDRTIREIQVTLVYFHCPLSPFIVPSLSYLQLEPENDNFSTNTSIGDFFLNC